MLFLCIDGRRFLYCSACLVKRYRRRAPLSFCSSKNTVGSSPIAPTRYNSVINACAKAGDWALTLWLFSEIKAAGLKADIQSFNAALDACTKGSNPEAALALLKRMRSQGLAPDAISYQSAISACRAGGDGASAVMLLKDMDKQGIEPRDGDYNLVIETVGKEGDWGGALELIKRMKAEGLTPDAYTYGAAVGACAKVQASVSERLIGDSLVLCHDWLGNVFGLYSHSVRCRGPLDLCESGPHQFRYWRAYFGYVRSLWHAIVLVIHLPLSFVPLSLLSRVAGAQSCDGQNAAGRDAGVGAYPNTLLLELCHKRAREDREYDGYVVLYTCSLTRMKKEAVREGFEQLAVYGGRTCRRQRVLP